MGQIHVKAEQVSKSLIALLKAGADYIDDAVNFVHVLVGSVFIHAKGAWTMFLDDLEALLLKLVNYVNVLAVQIGVAKHFKHIDPKLMVFALPSFLIALLILALWLKRKPKMSDEVRKTEITFQDVALQTASNTEIEKSNQNETYPTEEDNSQSQDQTIKKADPKASEMAQGKSGFTFFRKHKKGLTTGSVEKELEDDKFLLGIEQEMLATRQLYLDGLISKQVYVTETRSLYEKAQLRMT